MSKRLILLRHGKSDWDADYSGDRHRPLAKRGLQAARTMGRLLTAVDQIPEKVISSPALRARATAELAAEAGRWGCPMELDEGLYATSLAEVLDVVRRQDDDLERLLLIGHEPTWSNLAEVLSGGRVRVPTAAAVGIDFDVTVWRAVGPGRGRVVYVFPPRLFRSIELDR